MFYHLKTSMIHLNMFGWLGLQVSGPAYGNSVSFLAEGSAHADTIIGLPGRLLSPQVVIQLPVPKPVLFVDMGIANCSSMSSYRVEIFNVQSRT